MTKISNHIPINPIQQVKRDDRKLKEVCVPQPFLINEYNQNMRAVDLHDNDISNYLIKVRVKTCWRPLSINTIESTIVNTWKRYKD